MKIQEDLNKLCDYVSSQQAYLIEHMLRSYCIENNLSGEDLKKHGVVEHYPKFQRFIFKGKTIFEIRLDLSMDIDGAFNVRKMR